MAAVVAVGEGPPLVQPVETPPRPGEGVAGPAGGAAPLLLQEQLGPVRPAPPRLHLVLPVLALAEADEEAGPLAVLDQLVHGLVVALDTELVLLPELAGQADADLFRPLRAHPLGGRQPQVGGQAHGAVGEQVDVLAHAGVGSLHGPVRGQQVAHRQPRLQGGVELAVDEEAGGMQSEVGLQPAREAHVVLGVEAELQRVRDLGRQGRVLGGSVGWIGLDLRRPGAIGVQGGAAPGADVVGRVGDVVEVELQAPVADAGEVAQPQALRLPFAAADHGGAVVHVGGQLVAAVDGGEVAEEAVAEEVVPAQGGSDVAPSEVGGDGVLLAVAVAAVLVRHVAPEAVVAAVPAQVDAAAGREDVVHLGVDVVEVVAAAVVLGEEGAYQQVDVGAPPREDEGGAVPAQRPLHGELRGDEPHRALGLELLHVAVLHVDLQHRREAAAVTGREAGLGDLHVLDGVGVEDREEAEEVGGVVDRGVVEEDQVLVGAAAAHVEAAHALGPGLHAGQQLQGLEDVHLPHEDGSALDLPHRHLHHAHAALHLDRIEPLRLDLDGLHPQGLRLQGDVEL